MAAYPEASTSASPDVSPTLIATKVKKRKNFFSPSLKLQRQAFCLEQLRLHGIRSVFELGCGEGDLLAALCEPAMHRDDFPPYVHPEHRSKLAELKRHIPKWPERERELHIDRLAGIDIDKDRLMTAREATKPPVIPDDEDLETSFGRRERWEPLRVDLWQGSYAYYEEALDGFEAVVASEVIEHLRDETLSRFGPIVLGRYRPRIIVVTTPNYDFHSLFPDPGPGAPPNKNRTPDPTGRTNRIFRDDDHKFEFTGEEFRRWAQELADRYEYTVTFSGVGSATSYTRDPEADAKLYATQCAVFKRLYANESERAPRSPRTSPLAFLSKAPPAMAPVLRAAHVYSLDLPSEPDIMPVAFRAAQLRTLIAKAFYEDQIDFRLRDLWGSSATLRRVALGQIGLVFDAVVSAPSANRWALEIRPGGEDGEPLYYAEDAVWIVRKIGSDGVPAKLPKKAVSADEPWQPAGGWTRGSGKGAWHAIREKKKPANEEEDDSEDSDAYRQRGRPLTSSSEDDDE